MLGFINNFSFEDAVCISKWGQSISTVTDGEISKVIKFMHELWRWQQLCIERQTNVTWKSIYKQDMPSICLFLEGGNVFL